MKRFKPRILELPPYAKKWLLLDFLGILAGIAGGFGAILFREMIKYVHILFFEYILPLITIQVGNVNLGYIILPILGGLIVGPLIMRFARETKGHGVPEVLESVVLRGGDIRKRVAFFKIAVSSITIGSGGSAGREGPIAQIGSTIGSYLGQLFKLEPKHKKLLVVCGLSAGIAATFNAPLGGALFGLEVLLRGIGLFNAMPVILASIVGVAISNVFLGREPAFEILNNLASWTPQELPIYLLLGLVFGVISFVWVKVFYSFEGLFEKIKVPDSIKPAIGGLFTGIIIMFFPTYGIAGVGYDGINQALAGSLAIGLVFLLALMKVIATSFSIGSGGSGGIFAPSLYIGGMLGIGVGSLFKLAFPSLIQYSYTYGLAGMAALFAGAAQAPLNVIIMIPEMSNDYYLIPPIMLASISSFFIAWLLMKGDSIYTIKLKRRGIDIRMDRPYIMDLVKVEEVMTEDVVTIPAELPASVVELYYLEHKHAGYPVIFEGKLLGIVTINDLPPDKEDAKNITVGDITSSFITTAYPDETIHSVLEKMNRNKIGRVPVVKRENVKAIVGIISRHDIMQAYEIALKKTDEQTTI
ncbi:MAG: chloride channel protein [Candidatus Thorarchaeota archaeon]